MFGTVVLPAVFWIVLEPPERLTCPPEVPLYRVVHLDALNAPAGEIRKVVRLTVDYVNRVAYIVPANDEVIFCNGLE